MRSDLFRSKYFQNALILGFSLYSFTFLSGLAGCDNSPSAKDQSSTDQGGPVDVNPANPGQSNPPPGGTTPVTPPQTPPNSVKNVILLIGSGMGPQQIGEVVQYRRLRKPGEDKLALEKLMDNRMMGMVATNSYLDLVADTSAANSSIACGLKARNSTVGLDVNGKACQNILEKAKAIGKATGVVSNAELSGPGVAPYLAHQLDNNQQNVIAGSIFQDPQVDVILSGGGQHMIPQNKSTAQLVFRNAIANENFSDRVVSRIPSLAGSAVDTDPGSTDPHPGSDNVMKLSDVTECAGLDPALDGPSQRSDQVNVIELAKSKGYQFVCKGEDLTGIQPATDTKLLGIFSSGSFPRSPDRKALTSLPSLADLTGKAIDVLAQKPNGFLLVVQGGLTHQVAQENDPGTLLQEGLDFDAAISKALQYADAHSDTLVIVTADHETGGFSFAISNQPGNDLVLPSGDQYVAPYDYAPTIRYDSLMAQKKSFYKMTQDIVDQLYAEKPSLSLNEAGQMLVDDLQANSPYKLSLNQAKDILERAPGADNARTQDFSLFYIEGNIHADLLGRATAPQTSAVWSSGTPTSTPVLILASGPTIYADRVRGFIDNTEIGKIINDALAGK